MEFHPPMRTTRRPTPRARRAAALALTFVTLAVMSSCTWTDLAELGCLDQRRNNVDIPTNHALPYPGFGTYPDETTFDASGRSFNTGATSQYAMKIQQGRTGTGACVVGGSFTTGYHPEDTPWDTWHGSTSIHVDEPGFHLVGTRFYNVGDAVSFHDNAKNWSVTGVAVESRPGGPGGYVHDDCIENDSMNSGVIRDSKFDGCNASFVSSSLSHGDGYHNVVEVYDSLVRLQAFRNSYNVPRWGQNQHGGFFKWSPRNPNPTSGAVAPRLVVKNVMFRSDTRAAYGTQDASQGRQGLPPDSTCENVTLVAKGGWGSDPRNPTHPAWTAQELTSWKTQCRGLKFADEKAWDAAVADWDRRHPVD